MRKFALLLALGLGGCGATYEVCYTHPTYGEVCVKIGGKEYVKQEALPAPIADATKAHVEALKKEEAIPPK